MTYPPDFSILFFKMLFSSILWVRHLIEQAIKKGGISRPSIT